MKKNFDTSKFPLFAEAGVTPHQTIIEEQTAAEKVPTKVTLYHGDCLDVLRRVADEGAQYDACVTDPPYHLSATVSRFGHSKKFEDPGTRSRVNSSEVAGATARLARGFMGQTWDGGDIAFRRETWELVKGVLRPGAFLLAFSGTRTYHRMVCAIEDAGFVIQDQIAWMFGSGFPKRRDMLKPAWEPVCLAYKPNGTRTLQIEECRIGTDLVKTNAKNSTDSCFASFGADKWKGCEESELREGRWPANITHDGSDEVMEAFARFGESSSGKPREDRGKYGDEGSSARFFYNAKADAEDRVDSKHPTVKPLNLMKWLVKLVTPVGGTVLDPFAGTGSTGIVAAIEGRNAVIIEREDQYIADIERRMKYEVVYYELIRANDTADKSSNS